MGLRGVHCQSLLRHELRRRDIPDAGMGAVMIVVVLPERDLVPGLAERREQRLVQEFVSQPPVETLDEPVSRMGLAGAI